ncbi:MAG: hypothetical protein IJ237_09855 [Oscillospiraceae bacterium]|nr:hypothetical protein [Oscillospiraceae bacterium]
MTTEEVFAELREIVAEKERIFLVYKHTDPNGKVYIGYCCGDLKKRWKGGSGYHTNKRFHEAIKRIGPRNFTHEILRDNLTYPEALAIEREYILQYDSTNPEKGYNVVLSAGDTEANHYTVYTLHGPTGRVYAGYTGSPVEKRWKNGKNYKKNADLWEDIEYYGWDSFDKAIHGEHMDIRSARNFEYYLIRRYDLTDPEKGYNLNYGGFSAKGRTLTEEERKAMSEKFTAKPVRCVETGTVYPGIREAARATGLGHQNISAACHGKAKTCGGYHWELVKTKIW